mgnify:FL=1
MNKDEVKLLFNPSGQRGTFPKGTVLLDAARSLGVDIDSVCGGRGICCKCQIRCAEGKFLKQQIDSFHTNLSGRNDVENNKKNLSRLVEQDYRLSCQTKVLGDCVIDVPSTSQVHKQIIRKEADTKIIEINASIRFHYVELDSPDIDIPKSDMKHLLDALKTQWNLSRIKYDFNLLPKLQKILKLGDRKVTVAVFGERELITIWPGFHDKAFGVSLDVGSTTIAACLSDLSTGELLSSASAMNPQIRFGEDLMSRVSFAMMNSNGAHEMTKAIRVAINNLLDELVGKVNVSKDNILELSLVANPVMHHIFLGIDPSELGGAPFSLAVDSAVSTSAKTFGIDINDGGKIYVLPCIAGHVGADTSGVVLSEKPFESEQITLLVDIGTNAEIVLGNNKRLLACSSPTGPAFEGAQISCGQRATAGAIERVEIDPISLKSRFKVIGSDYWSNDEKFAESISSFGVNGICGSGIIEVIAEMYLKGVLTSDGVIDGNLAQHHSSVVADGRTFSYVVCNLDEENGDKRRIVITQNDIRQIQLAKAALYAGIKLLMEKMNITSLDKIKLAGAFGSHISVKHAMILGLIPDCDLKNVSSIGNAAETGARIALLNQSDRKTIEDVVLKIEKIETATAEKFQEHFVDAMAFPNKVDSFPLLFDFVDRPAEKVMKKLSRTRGRRN